MKCVMFHDDCALGIIAGRYENISKLIAQLERSFESQG
jgi:hypothetical protein